MYAPSVVYVDAFSVYGVARAATFLVPASATASVMSVKAGESYGGFSVFAADAQEMRACNCVPEGMFCPTYCAGMATAHVSVVVVPANILYVGGASIPKLNHIGSVVYCRVCWDLRRRQNCQ